MVSTSLSSLQKDRLIKSACRGGTNARIFEAKKSDKFSKESTLVRNSPKTTCAVSGTSKWKCDLCGKLVSKPGTLVQHHKKFHGVKDPMSEPNMNACSICGKNYQSKSALLYHVNSVHSFKLLKCEFCDKSFKHQRNLAAHKLRHGIKSKKCPYCSRAFYTASELGYHINGMHIQAKCWSCKFCGKEFSRSSSYQRHLIIHKSNRFVCEICHKDLKRKCNFQRHKKCHVENTNLNIKSATVKVLT